jgi:hypothetical protein
MHRQFGKDEHLLRQLQTVERANSQRRLREPIAETMQRSIAEGRILTGKAGMLLGQRLLGDTSSRPIRTKALHTVAQCGDLEAFCRRSPPSGNVPEPKHLFASFLSFLKCACNSNSHSFPTRAPESILPPANLIIPSRLDDDPVPQLPAWAHGHGTQHRRPTFSSPTKYSSTDLVASSREANVRLATKSHLSVMSAC